MIITDAIYENMLNSPVRSLRGRVEIYDGSTLVLTCGCHDALKSFSIERIGEEGKFFGFGICQRLNVHLIDKERAINVVAGNVLEVVFGVENNYMYPYPHFYITEVNRDEKTNELSITAYDDLYIATMFRVSELTIPTPYTIRTFAAACAAALNLPFGIENVDDGVFDTIYDQGANFDGSESIRVALNAIAEATQTIYYVNHNWQLTFKRLDRDGDPVLEIDKDHYFELDNRTNRRLSTITHATELGDNVSASIKLSGTTQFVRDNPFWELRDDIGDLLDNALAAIAGITINQFDCEWRGNYLLEIGDKIALTTKDNDRTYSYVLNDTVNFDGALKQHTEWSYTDNSMETEANPTSLGDALNHTYARVDKINRQINLVASETTANSEAISTLQINTGGINATVSNLEKKIDESIEGVNGSIGDLRKEVELAMSAEEVSIQIRTELANGVDKISTTTGYTFDDEGLTIDKSGSEMKTKISEDGMVVYRNDMAVLTANNVGVDAANLHATTYLIIGSNSRFEDYNLDGEPRTGCFWIGG